MGLSSWVKTSGSTNGYSSIRLKRKVFQINPKRSDTFFQKSRAQDVLMLEGTK
jgi:hypothetical protein